MSTYFLLERIKDMITTTELKLNEGYHKVMKVTKGKYSNLVIMKYSYVIIIGECMQLAFTKKHGLFAPFVKFGCNVIKPGLAIGTFNRVVGMLCAEKVTSKYFENPCIEDHLNHGVFVDKEKDIPFIKQLAKEDIQYLYEES